MFTADQIKSLCPLSKRPFYVVFRRSSDKETGVPFWYGVKVASDKSEAVFSANIQLPYPNPAHDCFVLETTFEEAHNLVGLNAPKLSDDEVSIYRYEKHNKGLV